MPKRVYNNVAGHRVIDDGRVVEDVTSVTLPTIEHPTTTIDANGMVMALDMPNTTRLNAMEFAIAHNNGVNGRHLSTPGKHQIEVRVARQRYDVNGAEINLEPMKVRVTGIHKSTDKGTLETGNPYGSTEKYSVIRYEEELDGESVCEVDAVSGVYRANGQSCTDELENILN